MSEPGPASDRLRRMASDYEEATSAARSEQIVARAMARARAGQHPRRLLMEGVLGASILFALAIGLGVATAGTLPGDAFYGVSRAYEGVGTLVGVVDPLEQRLNEVIALADRGDRTRAALAASEALKELERKTGFTVPASPIAAPGTTTTTVHETPDPSKATTPPTTAPTVSVDADPEPEEEDPVQTMRIAAETMLRNAQADGGEVEKAASQLAAAAATITAAITAEEEQTPVADSSTTVPGASTSTSSSTTTTSTTSTTTTTTVPSSTTTTVPGGEGGGSSGGDDGPGPIFLPPDF